MKKPDNHIIVIFGASGDLTKRKLIPALYELERNSNIPDKFVILGVGRTQYSDEKFREVINDSLKKYKKDNYESSLVDTFIKKLNYISLNTPDINEYVKLKSRLKTLCGEHEMPENFIFYLATPPTLYETIAQSLYKYGLTSEEDSGWKRIVVEKPFGFNLESAKSLNKNLIKYFKEDQIYRIDHYLGKETVQNVLVTRFSNGIFEPLWNRNYIHHIEITSAESLGVEKRGGYYDKSGALRDMVQNHLLQLVGLIAMEPPTLINSTAIRNEILKVFQSLIYYSEDEIDQNAIRGQYISSVIKGEQVKGYREEENVVKDSKTETFVALKLFIENWRWGGVPFYIRCGKRLPTSVTEIVIHFKPTPHRLFCFDQSRINHDNQLVIRIQPDEGILLKYGMKVPGAGFIVRDVFMDFHYSDFGEKMIPDAYQRLIYDCMQGDLTLYSRAEEVEEAWKFVTPILNAWQNNPDIHIYGYPAGSWGPNIADSLIEGKNMTWRYPCKNLTNSDQYCEL